MTALGRHDPEMAPLPHAARLAAGNAIVATTPIRGTRRTDWRMLIEAVAGVLIIALATYAALVLT